MPLRWKMSSAVIPDVVEVAVYPVPDPVWTEAVMASVVLRKESSLTAEEIIEYCRQHNREL